MSNPAAAPATIPIAYPYEAWTATSGDLAQRRAPIATPPETPAAQLPGGPAASVPIVIDPADRRQPWVGQGAAITDSAASLIWGAMDADQRHRLLAELFDPVSGAGFNMVRVPIGSTDFNEQDYYTYDDLPFGEHDCRLDRFRLGTGEPGAPDATGDLKYIVPVLQEILSINPGVKVVASPWSAPAWMKNTGHLTLGGRLRFGEWTGNGFDPMKDSFEGVYARYFVRYIDEMAKYGIPVWALTIQNEPANASPWPAMIWSHKEMAAFGANYLRPALDATHPEVKLFFLDDNTHTLTHPLDEDVTAHEAASFDGIAVHTYESTYGNLFNATRSFPNWSVMMSERRCMMRDSVEDASHIMFGVSSTWLIRNGMGMITLWNLALDERGLPNKAGSTGRRGVVTIQHETGEVQRNLEYFMLRNLGQDVSAGSVVIGSSSYSPNGYEGGLTSAAFLAPDGSVSAIIYNPTGSAVTARVTVSGRGDAWQAVDVPAWGTVTVRKSFAPLNLSDVPADDDFPLDPSPAHFSGDRAPGR